MVLRISYENRWTRTPCRGYASLRKATDPYGSRDSSHHIAGGGVDGSRRDTAESSNAETDAI